MKALRFSLSIILGLAVAAPLAGAEESVLYDFSKNESKPEWRAQNDGVMGGVSKGKGTTKSGRLIFQGRLSLENNGGFASLQTAEGSWNLSSFRGVCLRVKGDGRTYQFRVATDARMRNSRIDYKAPFETEKGKWTEVFVPFSKMIPTFHGRELKGPELDLTKVEQLRVMLADGQEGPFKLVIDDMTAQESP